MLDALKKIALIGAPLPIAFTPDAWQLVVQPQQHDANGNIQLCRLSKVILAAFETHLAHPHALHLAFEVVQAKLVGSAAPSTLKLSLNLLNEPKEPSILLIDLLREYPQLMPYYPKEV